MRFRHAATAGLLCAVLAACGTPAKIRHIDNPQPRQFADLPDKTYPVQFRKIVINLDRGAHVGAIELGLACVPQGDLAWQGGRLSVDPTEFDRVFREEAAKVRLNVAGDPDALFQDPDTWRAEYLLGGRITRLKANLCYPYSGFGNASSSKGEAELAVEWQVYSRLKRRVVYKVETMGSASLTQAQPGGDTLAVLNAFSEATQGLLGDPDLRQILLRDEGGPQKQAANNAPATAGPGIELMAPRSAPADLNAVRPSVVTIFAGDGHGSGFFISDDGYLITSSHVVEDAERVLIRGPDGDEAIARIVRTDRQRDVALLRAEADWIAPLAVRLQRPDLGEGVLAVGSPYLPDLAASVTKGIVSGYREDRGFPMLQSDASINPGNSGGPLIDENGNVVGIAVSGLRAGGGQTGINFFVPIASALQSLGVKADAEG